MTASETTRSLVHRSLPLQSWLVLTYLAAAYWVTQRLLSDWVTDPNLNFFLIQPAIWLGLAALAYAGWRRLPTAPRFNRAFVVTAALIGVVHVAGLVISGLVGGMGTVRTRFDWLPYLENTWYVGTLLIGIETARTYLFHVWNLRSSLASWVFTVSIFFVAVTPYGQFESLGTLDRAIETTGGRLIPAFAISVVATWFAAHGGMGASLAYRVPILAFLWYSMVLPDLHWSTTLAVGVAAPVIAWNLAGPLAEALGALSPD